MKINKIIILHLLLFLVSGISSQSVDYKSNILRFKAITIDDGLSNNKVNVICADKDGYIWFGTNDGLNRYDGYNIQIFKQNLNDSLSINNNYITDITADNNGNLWIGTTTGLTLYNNESQHFNEIKFGKNKESIGFVGKIYIDQKGSLWVGVRNGLYYINKNSSELQNFSNKHAWLDRPKITALWIDSKNNLCIGTEENGLYLYNIDTKWHSNYKRLNSDKNTISGNWIESIYEDKEKQLWIGTKNNGLNLYDYNNETFTRIVIDESQSRSLRVRDIKEDNQGRLWLGTATGLYVKDKTTAFYKYSGNYTSTLSNNSIYDICIDKTGNLWLGTYAGGVNYADMYQKKITTFYSVKDDPRYLNNNIVLSIVQDTDNNLWIGTETGGLNFLNRSTGLFTYYMHDSKNEKSISTNNIKSIRIDPNNNLWIATYHGGLNYFNRSTNTFKRFLNDSKDPSSIVSNDVYEIALDSSSNLWIGTKKGIDLLKNGSNEFIHFPNQSGTKFGFGVREVKSIYIDSKNKIWVGGFFENIFQYSAQDSGFAVFTSNIPIKDIISFCEDSKGNMWAGGLQGLYYIPKDKQNIQYTEYDGLPANTIFRVFEDDIGNLWMSTTKGLSKFRNAVNTPKQPDFRNYDVSDGLQSNQFTYNSNFVSKTGEIFIGGVNGFNAFYPKDIINNPVKPTVVITGLKIFNREVKINEEINGKVVLNKNISYLDELVLSYKHNVFSFEFSALHYSQPNKNKYQYKLKGFEKEWNFTSADKRIATYTNLEGGDYIFMVKASNNDGVWNENPTILKIKILPPFYKTWSFRIALFLIITGLALAFYRIRINSLKKQQYILEETVKKRTLDLRKVNAELIKQKETISTISEFGQKLTATINVFSINNMIFDFVSSIMDCTNFGVSIYDQNSKSLYFPAMLEDGKLLPTFHSHLSDETSCAVWCFSNNEIIFSNDFHSDYKKYISDLNIRTSQPPQSLMYIPLVVGEKKIGVITVQSYKKDAYSQQDKEILQALASYIAIALDNANAYQQLEQRNLELRNHAEALNEANAVVEERQMQIEEQSEELFAQKNELEEANKLLQELISTKDKFFSIVAHDIKNPLNTIIGFTQLLHLKYKKLSEEKKQFYVRNINNSSHSLSKLLENLLQWARTQTNSIKFNPVEISFDDIINENITLFRESIEKKKINIEIDLGRDNRIRVDQNMINTVVRNLLSNAIKFTDNEGSIYINTYKKKDLIYVCIKDNGIGMENGILQNIFKISNKTSMVGTNGETGTGLGLLICKEFVEINGGTINANSEPGKGSEFIFTIPAYN